VLYAGYYACKSSALSRKVDFLVLQMWEEASIGIALLPLFDYSIEPVCPVLLMHVFFRHAPESISIFIFRDGLAISNYEEDHTKYMLLSIVCTSVCGYNAVISFYIFVRTFTEAPHTLHNTLRLARSKTGTPCAAALSKMLPITR